jgi:putative acetyltransferase
MRVLIAEDDRVIGHILFSPVAIESADKSSDEHSAKEASTSSKQLAALGLAPLAVLPEFQNHNIGTLLTHAGLDECRKVGCECVVRVLASGRLCAMASRANMMCATKFLWCWNSAKAP